MVVNVAEASGMIALPCMEHDTLEGNLRKSGGRFSGDVQLLLRYGV